MNYDQVHQGFVPEIKIGDVEAFYVDLDDTLVDYKMPCRLGLQEILEFVPGLKRTGIEVIEKDFHEILRQNLPKILDNEVTVNAERLSRIDFTLRLHGKKAERFELEFYDEVFQYVFWKSRKPVPGAIEFLQMCRNENIPVIVITNGSREMQERTIQESGIGDYIEGMLVPGSSQELKPNRTLFEKAVKITNARKSRTFMIGDSWQYDVIGALNSGIRPIWINRKGERPPSDSDITWVYTIGEITKIWRR